jgi:hypothetical protein
VRNGRTSARVAGNFTRIPVFVRPETLDFSKNDKPSGKAFKNILKSFL